MNRKKIEKLKKNTIDGLNFVKEIIDKNNCDILILDEALWALEEEYITTEDRKNILKSKSETIEIILTGRNAGQDLLILAHLIIEMKKIKHSFDNGINARTGIEK